MKKFRIFDNINKEMIYHDDKFNNSLEKGFFIDQNNEVSLWDGYEIFTYDNRFESLFFTGKKDKTGKDIYDQDIIMPGLGLIYYDDLRAQFRVKWYTKTWKIIRGGGYSHVDEGEPLFINSDLIWEVVGNTCENSIEDLMEIHGK